MRTRPADGGDELVVRVDQNTGAALNFSNNIAIERGEWRVSSRVERGASAGLPARPADALAPSPLVGYTRINMTGPITTPPGFDELPVEEKVAYVQALWDLIASEADAMPVPGWQQAVIEQRLAEARADSAAVRGWPEVQAELRARLLAVHGR